MNPAATIIEDLLAASREIALQAHDLLTPVASARDELRARLLDGGHILPIADPPTSQPRIAAVDGACVREHLYAADLLVAAATAADGLHPTASPLPAKTWQQVIVHDSENDTLLSAAMAALELAVLGATDRDLRIVDGAHGTPVIALSTAFFTHRTTVAETAAHLVDDDVLAGLHTLATDTGVIALPKADSATEFTRHYATTEQPAFAGGDKFLATQVLQPGEMLYPRAATSVGRGLRPGNLDDAPGPVQTAARAVDEAAAPLRARARNRALLVTYVRPRTADTVLKVEYKPDTSLSETLDHHQPAVRHGQQLAAVLSEETPGPHLQEPYPQHAVDRLVKQVGLGTQALSQAMLANLPAGSDSYVHLLARSYRTS